MTLSARLNALPFDDLDARRTVLNEIFGGHGRTASWSRDPVPVLLSEVADVRADRLEDPQSAWPQKAHERKVKGVGRLPRSGEHGLELQVR